MAPQRQQRVDSEEFKHATLGGQHLRRVVQLENLEPANEVIFISETETGKTLRIIHTQLKKIPA